jgi:hypothetical protein
MMDERQTDQAALFYKFSLEQHVPADDMLRAIDRFVDLDGVRTLPRLFVYHCEAEIGSKQSETLKIMATWLRSTVPQAGPRSIRNC